MRKRLRKSIAGILALLMVVGSFQLNGLQVKADEQPTTEDITYTMQEMGDPIKVFEVDAEDSVDGGKKLTFATNERSIFYAVPEELDDAEITKITFNVKSVSGIDGAQNWWFGYKMFTADGYENDVWGNGIGEGNSMYGNPTREVPTDLEAPIKYLAITSANEGVTSPIDMEISGITFTVKKATTPEGGSGNNQPGDDQTGGESGDNPNTPAKIMDITYNFVDLKDLKEADGSWGVDSRVSNGGEVTMNFSDQYAEQKYRLPAEIASLNIQKVTLNLTSGDGGELALKLYSDEGVNVQEIFHSNTISPTVEFATLGIMAANGATDVKISGITFTVEGEAEITKTYTFKDLVKCKSSGVSSTVSEAGAETFSYTGKNQEEFYEIPKEIDASKVHKVTFNVSSGNGEALAYKFYTEEGFGGDWPSAPNEQVSYCNPAAVIASGFTGMKYFGIMSMNNEEYSATVDSVTFHTTGWGYIEDNNENPPAETNVVTFNFKELEKYHSYGVDLKVGDGGELTAEYQDQYQESFYKLPESIDSSKVKKIELVLSSGSSVCIKLYPDVNDTKTHETTHSVSMVPSAEFEGFGIMNQAGAGNTVKVSGVKITVEDALENVEIKKTYTFNELVRDAKGDTSATVDSTTGAVTYSYTGHYQEAFYAIPKEIDMEKVHKVTFNVSSGNADALAYKFYTATNYAGADNNNWPKAPESQVAYGNPVVELANGFDGIEYFGIMSRDNTTYTAVVDSVTFHTTGWGYSDVVKEPTVGGDKVFQADDVSVPWGSANYDEQVEGKINVQFKVEDVDYPQVRIYLGEELNMADCTSIKFEVADQTAPVTFKLWQGASEIKAWPGNTGSQEYVFTPGVTDTIDSIGIMYSDTAANVPENASISFISVTFTMKEGSSSAEDEYYETDDTQGDNLITNPNFADADLSMWGAAQGESTITTGVSETPIFADVKTYGIISGRTSNYEAFAQDLTGKVQNNKEYSFSFFAKLSDDYADAPSSQRQITFGPYEVTDGNPNYNIQVSGSPKTLTAGKWTKVTGTFKMASLGDPDQVVVRLLEQGENYGGGPGVKGEYYITGVSVKEIVKEKVEIEKDIPDWQSAIVKDLGAGTIAGTAVTYNEMADEAVWELVTKHFNAITFGNEFKLDAMIGGAKGATEHITFNGKDLEVPVLKLEDKAATKMLDKVLEWNTANPDKKIKVRGHVLVWHSQAPDWFFKENYDAKADFVSKDVMDLRLEWYIKTILEYYTGSNSKYKDLFYGWDVVNEAISDNTSTYRAIDEGDSGAANEWASIYGSQSNDYIIKAFQWANKYAPASLELYYNDYNDCVPAKVEGIVELLKAVKNAEGTRIDGMGMQAHHNMDSPSVEQVEAAVRAYCEVVGKVQWTELDIKASSAYDGTDATRVEEWNKMAHRYKAYYDVLKKLDAEEGIEVSGIIFWGVVDKYSWLQTSNSVGGASNGGNQCPLLFDDNYKAKPAYWAFVDPDRLTPEVKNIVIGQKVDNTYPSGVEYSMEKGATKATVIPMWDTTGLKVLVKVQDATVDAADAVTVYVDPAMKGGATTPVKATVKRADAKAVKGGYEAEVSVALDSVGALKKVSMDVVVVNGTEKVAFNDTTFAQETSSKYYANALMKVGTTVQNGTIVVDGVVDAEWAEADAIPLGLGSVQAKPTFKILWDKEYLYVLAEVQDSVLNKDNKDAWMQDSIEVFIDENNKKTAGYDGDDKQYRINYANELTTNGQKCTAENMKSAAKVVDGGYVIEAAFKWTDIKPANGTNVGLELQLNDAESSTVRNKLSWADDTDKGWESSRVFGTITLVGDPTLPELVEDLEVLLDKNATMQEKIEAVKDVIAKVQEVVEVGNTEELTNEIVAEIEDLFAEAIGRVLEIVNKDNKVPQIKKVIGAIIGINLEKDATMVFEAVTAPSLDAKYKNAFAFDAKLFAGDKITQPLVPVTIRMEVPSSIDKNGKVAVLHYKDGAKTPEKLAARIIDGLLEFTTPSFSTFVVVNEVEEQSPDSSTGTTPGGSTGSSSSSSAPATTPAPSTDSGVKAPATGDSAYPVAAVAVLLLSGSSAIIMARKKKEEEEK